MKRLILLCGVVTICLAFSEHIEPEPNDKYIETLQENRASYKAHRAAKVKTKIKIIKSEEVEKKAVAPQKIPKDDEIMKKEENKIYKKLIIKQRAKRNPEKYHYQVIRKSSELENAGVEVKSKQRDVHNYVEVKNVVQNPFKKRGKNLGVIVDKKAKVKKVENIVTVKNSTIHDQVNSGVKVKSKKLPSQISNSVTFENSEIGE